MRTRLLVGRPRCGPPRGARPRLASTIAAGAPPRPGLFGVTGLDRPGRLPEMAAEAKAECERLFHRIMTTPPGVETLNVMDEISDAACMVLDLAECCRIVHPDPEWVDAADQAYLGLADYIGTLNTSVDLYRILCQVSEVELNGEEEMMLFTLKLDMENNGIHLPEDVRAKVMELQSRIGTICSRFQSNIATSKPFTIVNTSGLSAPSFSQRISRNLFTGTATVPSDQQIVNEILMWTSNPFTRKEVLQMFERQTIENGSVLEELVNHRSELATLVGCDSFAHLEMKRNIVKNPASVVEQLDNISKHVRAPAELDANRISEAKYADGFGRTVNISDLQFYIGRLKATECRISAQELSNYFSLQNCIGGLQILTKRLFGCTLKVADMRPEECWDKPELLKKLTLEDEETGQDLGTIYLDLFQRHGKGGAVCFSLRSSKVSADNVLRTPKVVMACSFSGVDSSSGSVDTILLRHHEFETLLHEFGHALHLVFSRTRYQNLSGFRGPLDFVETPSHLMEHFAWDHRFLQLFAKHHRTGDPIPIELINRLRKSKNLFRGMDLLGNLMRSKIDQLLFGPQPVPFENHISLVRDVMQELYPIDVPREPLWHLRCEHYVHYAGGYYSYLYGRMFGSQIWKSHFEEDPLNLDAGQDYRKLILEPGASKEPELMLQELLGVVDPSAKLEEVFDYR